MPFSEIARRLDVSPGMVRQRFNRLVEMGVLQVAVISNRLVLGHSFMAILSIDVDPGRVQEVAEAIAEFDEVIYLVVLAGTFNVMAEVSCRDGDHLLEFLEQRLGRLDGVRRFESFVHLRIVKEVYV